MTRQRPLPLPRPRASPRPLSPCTPALELPEDYGEGLEPSDEPIPEWLLLPWESAA